jgi:hypothetical protein
VSVIESGAARAGMPLRKSANAAKTAVKIFFMGTDLKCSRRENPNLLGKYRLLLH